MKIDTFDKLYGLKRTVDDQKDFVLTIMKQGVYVPFETKCELCDKIIETTRMDTSDGKTTVYRMETAGEWMLYSMVLVMHYTNLDVDFKNVLDQFNMLNKSGALQMILSFIPKEERDEFDMVKQMKGSDFYENHFSTRAYLSQKLDALYFALDGLAGSLADAVKNQPDEHNPGEASTEP